MARGFQHLSDRSTIPVTSVCRRKGFGRRIDEAAREGEARSAPASKPYLDLMADRAPNTDGGEPERSSEALLDELVRALARQIAERDYAALRNKPRPAPRSAGGTKDSG